MNVSSFPIPESQICVLPIRSEFFHGYSEGAAVMQTCESIASGLAGMHETLQMRRISAATCPASSATYCTRTSRLLQTGGALNLPRQRL